MIKTILTIPNKNGKNSLKSSFPNRPGHKKNFWLLYKTKDGNWGATSLSQPKEEKLQNTKKPNREVYIYTHMYILPQRANFIIKHHNYIKTKGFKVTNAVKSQSCKLKDHTRSTNRH